jgi:hypothetical protein
LVDLVPQASFNSGEWAPALYARVDLPKYRAGAALLENFYVDYRGGASTRPGTKYVLQAYKSATPVRLIPFQASFNVGYALEFGHHYIRFYYKGSPIVETGVAITAITRANPCVMTVPGHTYVVGDWVFVTAAGGMVQVDGRYFSITNVAGNDITLADLNGAAINSTGYTAYTAGGTTARVYTLTSPYAATDLALLKYAQATNEMVICHPSYAPQLLTLIAAANWTIAAIVFGSTASPPAAVSIATTLGGGSVNYSYVVTSLDAGGQESGPSAAAPLANKQDIRSVAGSNQITWTPVTGALGYNVYESYPSYFGVVPSGVSYGFIGTVKGVTFIDSNIGANFSEGPPVAQNPFVGNGVSFITVTAPGAYTTVPTASLSGGAPAIPAVLSVSLGVVGVPAITAGGATYVVGDTINFGHGLIMTVLTVAAGTVTSWSVAAPGSITSGGTPANPMAQVTTSGTGTGAQATATWGVAAVIVQVTGAGYGSVPTVAFSAGAATATATLSGPGNGNPSVPGFFQQRLVLAGPAGAPQTFNMSQPGSYFNFNITDPVQADNAITGTLVSGVLQDIKSLIPATAGMIVLTDKGSWLINGGSAGSAISPTSIVANLQSAIGANDVPPIISNYDILFVQAKGSAVRDISYNIYYNVFTGSDISINASHLFFGYEILEWAWAEQPFYVVWAVRNDGTMLTLTFLKEQEFVGWSHQVTQGLFKSVCTVTESTTFAGNVDAVYTVVQRVVNGNTVQYIERIVDRVFPTGLGSAWCVDSGIQYTGAPALTFVGAEHLGGKTVTALLVDDTGLISILLQFVMPVSGIFTLPAPAGPATGYTTVTLGLAYTCKLQTLAIDVGQVPVQGKLKKEPYVDVRVNQSVGLEIGLDFNNLVSMKDLQRGGVISMATGLNLQVNLDLYSGDARTYLPPSYNIYGQYCIQQAKPYPATVLGVFPNLIMGDTDVGRE